MLELLIINSPIISIDDYYWLKYIYCLSDINAKPLYKTFNNIVHMMHPES